MNELFVIRYWSFVLCKRITNNEQPIIKMLKRILLILVLACAIFGTASTSFASGMGPGDAIYANGETITIAANSAQWFKFDVGGKKADVSATLNAASAEVLRLAIYTPEQVAAYQNGSSLKAIGSGSVQENYALAWFGEFNQAGTYYAVVYNDTGTPMDVQLRVQGDAVTTQAATTSAPTKIDDPLQKVVPVNETGIEGKIAFVDATGGNLYAVNGDGTNLKTISYGMDPQWNGDGTQIALARQGPVAGIFTINADGSNETLLYQTNEPRSPAWSADDSQIVFSYQGATKGGGTVSFRGRTFERPSTTDWNLGLVNLSDGSYQDIRSSDNATTPTWNSDGTIAYNDTAIGLMTTSANGEPSENPFIGDLRNTTDSYNPLRIRSPQYSPDGTKIVYVVQQSPTWQIAIANADGSDQHLLTSDNALWLTHPDNVAPVWSPDGTQILFLSNRNGAWEFFTMNTDGTNVQQVLKDVTDQITITYDYQAARMMSWTE